MFDLKPISKKAIPSALEKVTRYRLLNEPWQAESICRDILNADPDNQEALYLLVLTLTDQFGTKLRASLSKALEAANQLEDSYLQDYSKGLIYERQATSALKRGTPRSDYIAYEYLRKAMDWYEKAEESRPAKNEESILRWNACARMIMQNKLKPAPEEKGAQPLLDV